MKKCLLYFLLFAIIADNIYLGQLAKLPALYRHFTEHKTLLPQLSFADYLSMHYWGQDLDDNDDERDMQLPFKKFDHHSHPFLFLTVPDVIPVKQDFYWHIRQCYAFDHSQKHSNPALGSLFRPPRA